MHLHRYGSRHGPAVVLVHGIPGSADSWSQVAELLAPDHDVVVVDLLGFGHSPRTDQLLAPAQATALLDALDRAGIDHATFAGHDFGGPVVLSLYRRAPQRFDGLALIATNAFPDTPIPFPLSSVTLPVIGTALARVLFSRPALAAMLRRYDGEQLGDAASVRSIFTRSLQDLAGLYAEYPHTLASVTGPASVVWGTEDPFFPVEQARRTAGLIADAELVLIDGAGHFLPEQRPNPVADAIRRLVKRAAERRGDDARDNVRR